MKKTSSAIYIPNMDAKEFDKICAEKGLQFIYTPVPPHGDLIDRDALTFEDDYYGWRDKKVAKAAPTILEAEEGEK